MEPIGIIVTMAIQIGTSIINRKYNKQNLDNIRKLKQESKSTSQNHSLKRDYERYLRSCEFQRQIEEENHVEKLKDIEQEFINSFRRLAHDAALKSHYPLKISPYIIGKSVISINSTQLSNYRQNIFCVLTNSNDKSFNKSILPVLDTMLCSTVSTYWNQSSMHTMCYYTEVWSEKHTFCDEDIDNLKAILATPTITITPFFELNNDKNMMFIKINVWGIGNELPSYLIDTDIQYDSIPKSYTSNDIDNFISKLYPSIVRALAQTVDVYYWTNYYQAPLFPSILKKGILQLNQTELSTIGKEYSEIYESLALGNMPIVVQSNNYTENQRVIKDIAEINQYNFPERSVNFLRSITNLIKNKSYSERLIKKTVASIYEARTDDKFVSFVSIDVTRLDKKGMDLITKLIFVAKECENFNVAKDLTSIIERKILTWN